MFNLKEEILNLMELFVEKEYAPALAEGASYNFSGCMDCSNSCAEKCAYTCRSSCVSNLKNH